jgi:hypothetical protein
MGEEQFWIAGLDLKVDLQFVSSERSRDWRALSRLEGQKISEYL